MFRTAHPWKGAGVLMLGGALLSGASAFGADEPTLSDQLSDLGRQALAQGNGANAKSFFKTALELDPTNKKASRGLAESERRRSDRARGHAGPGTGSQAGSA